MAKEIELPEKTSTTLNLDHEMAGRAFRRAIDHGVRNQTATIHFALHLLVNAVERKDGTIECTAEQIKEAAKYAMRRKPRSSGERGELTTERFARKA